MHLMQYIHILLLNYHRGQLRLGLAFSRTETFLKLNPPLQRSTIKTLRFSLKLSCESELQYIALVLSGKLAYIFGSGVSQEPLKSHVPSVLRLPQI